MARGVRAKQNKKPKMCRERDITESPDPRLSKLLPRQLGAGGLLGDEGSPKPPMSRISLKRPLLGWCPLAMSFADLVILPTSHIGCSCPRERDLWAGDPLNTNLQGLPKAVFKSCVFRHLQFHKALLTIWASIHL